MNIQYERKTLKKKKKVSHQAENELEHRSQYRNKEMSGGRNHEFL